LRDEIALFVLKHIPTRSNDWSRQSALTVSNFNLPFSIDSTVSSVHTFRERRQLLKLSSGNGPDQIVAHGGKPLRRPLTGDLFQFSGVNRLSK
jgi:hypothetical protein